MRALFAIIGVLLFGAFSAYFLGGFIADKVADFVTAESPDDVNATHSLAWLATVFVSALVGWYLGWMAGDAVSGQRE